jgi:hypothetical protein
MHIPKVDAQGKKEVLEEIRRFNIACRRIEEESASRTGEPLGGPDVRMVAVPIARQGGRRSDPEAQEGSNSAL